MTFHCYLNELQSKESVLYTLYTPTITINHRVVAEESILPLVTVIENENEKIQTRNTKSGPINGIEMTTPPLLQLKILLPLSRTGTTTIYRDTTTTHYHTPFGSRHWRLARQRPMQAVETACRQQSYDEIFTRSCHTALPRTNLSVVQVGSTTTITASRGSSQSLR